MSPSPHGPSEPEPAADIDTDPDDVVAGADGLADDVRNGDLSSGEPAEGLTADTDTSAPIVADPELDVIHDENDAVDGG